MSNNNGTISAIEGITVGHVTDDVGLTGVTVICFSGEGATAAVSVQGAAPGTRETDVLEPGNLVEKAHAIVLAGGSAYGLDAASGVMSFLEDKGIGLSVSAGMVVPIVPAAVLLDLHLGSASVRPTAEWGRQAAEVATSAPVLSGNIGAGAGATVGKLAGADRATKGGLGNALIDLGGGVLVAAIVAVNAVGEVVDSLTGTVVAGVKGDKQGEYLSSADLAMGFGEGSEPITSNTTLGLIVTNAALSKTELKKVAEMAHDGMARSIRPVHTQFDGDAVFAVSLPNEANLSGDKVPTLNAIGVAAGQALERAILDGVMSAKSVPNAVAQCDWA